MILCHALRCNLFFFFPNFSRNYLHHTWMPHSGVIWKDAAHESKLWVAQAAKQPEISLFCFVRPIKMALLVSFFFQWFVWSTPSQSKWRWTSGCICLLRQSGTFSKASPDWLEAWVDVKSRPILVHILQLLFTRLSRVPCQWNRTWSGRVLPEVCVLCRCVLRRHCSAWQWTGRDGSHMLWEDWGKKCAFRLFSSCPRRRFYGLSI